MSNKGCLAKQLQQCLSSLHSFTDGQVQMVEVDWDEMKELTLDVQPNDGIYKGGRFRFTIYFSSRYPTDAPEISCTTHIYHPNIDPESESNNVCVSLLNDWAPNNTIEDLVFALLFLMYNPNTEDPLSGFVPSDIDKNSFEETQQAILRGENPLQEDHDLDANFWKEAQEKYADLSPEEWEVLGEAAKVEWQFKIENEQWQQDIKTWEVEQAEEEQKRLEEERIQAQQTQEAEQAALAVQLETEQANTSVTSLQKSNSFLLKSSEAKPIMTAVNHAFGKSTLQRYSTVTLASGQAAMLGFQAPQVDTINQWNTIKTVPTQIVEEAVDMEEDMDCSEAPVHHVDNNVPYAWKPYCETNIFNKPSLQRGFTF